MTPAEIKTRLEAIRPHDWRKDVFLQWYEVDLWGGNSELFLYIEQWALKYLGRKKIHDTETANRIAFEGYLQSQNMMPLAVAADQLAVPRDQFMNLLNRMAQMHLLKPSTEWREGLCGSELPEKLPAMLPSFPRRVFANIPSKIRTFHESLRKDLDLELEMVTTRPIDSDTDVPAYQRDIITLEPVSLGDSVWLDFKKPISLRPDICAKRTYLRYKEQLVPFRMGPEPEWARESTQSRMALT